MSYRTRLRYEYRNALGWARENPLRAALGATLVGAMIAGSLFFIAPLYWLFSAAFKPEGTMEFPPELIPSEVTIQNLATVATETRFIDTYFVNSLIVSGVTVALTIAIATMAGYALSRYELPYQKYLMLTLLVVQMIPILAMIIPLYRVFSVLGLLDTLTVIILTNTVLVVPIATWLIKGYFDTIPDGLEEAARVGGASRFQAFRVIVPLARPAISASAIYAFVQSWNQFVIPLTFTNSESVTVFPVGLYQFIGRRGVVQWGLLGAASIFAMLPVLILFVTFQRQFVAGLMGGELKGE